MINFEKYYSLKIKRDSIENLIEKACYELSIVRE